MRTVFSGLEETVETAIDDVGRARRHTEFNTIRIFAVRSKFVVQLSEEELEKLIEGVNAGVGKRVVLDSFDQSTHILDGLELTESEWPKNVAQVLTEFRQTRDVAKFVRPFPRLWIFFFELE